MVFVEAAAAGDCEVSYFDGVARQQTPSQVDWLNVNLGMMRMAWTTIRCRLRSLMDYHTIFEYSRCPVPPQRGWVAWWNDVELSVADVDCCDCSGAGGSAKDGLDGVSVLPRGATFGNWLALTCCDDDMNAIREIVSPKKKSISINTFWHFNSTYFIIWIMSEWTLSLF